MKIGTRKGEKERWKKSAGRWSSRRRSAVFGLDARGRWQHVEQGLFENPRIIAYFHSCIRKDEMGYHLVQDHGHIREKVYFPYEDTALFVFDVLKGDPPILVLNTRESGNPCSPKSSSFGAMSSTRASESTGCGSRRTPWCGSPASWSSDDEGSAFIPPWGEANQDPRGTERQWGMSAIGR